MRRVTDFSTGELDDDCNVNRRWTYTVYTRTPDLTDRVVSVVGKVTPIKPRTSKRVVMMTVVVTV